MRIILTETTWATSALAHDLSRLGHLVTRADTGEDAVALADISEEDGGIVDFDLPDADPIDCIRNLRAASSNLSLVALCPADDRPFRLRALAAGADAAIPRRLSAREIAARFAAIARRRAGHAVDHVCAGNVEVSLIDRQARVQGQTLRLSPHEFALLEFLVLRPGQVVSDDAIMTRLYGHEEMPDDGIVKVFISHMRKKIAAVGGDPTIIRNLWGRGYTIALDAPKADVLPLAA